MGGGAHFDAPQGLSVWYPGEKDRFDMASGEEVNEEKLV